jgi:hypothetical protein
VPRLVVFADRDRAGSWTTLAHALRTLGLADARVVTLADDPALAWPHDIAEVFDGGQELGHLVRTADLLVFVDVLPDELGLFDGMLAARARDGRTRVLVQCDDAPTPLRAHAIARAVGREGWSLATTRPPCTTLAAAGARFLAPFVPWWRAPLLPLAAGTRLRLRRNERIVYASSTTPLREQPLLEGWIDRAEQVAAVAPGVRVEIMTARGHAAVAQRRRRAHLVLAGAGIGRTALEAMAQGVPTVAQLDDDARAAWTKLAGTPPPVVAPDALEQAITELIPTAEPNLALRRWVGRAADPHQWLRACETWLARRPHARAA